MKKTKLGYQITITFDDDEADFIVRFAKKECRTPNNLVRWLTLQKAEEKGYKRGGKNE